MNKGLSDFFHYNLWANLCLLDACMQLSDTQLDATTNGVFGSVRETLMHLCASEESYALSVTGEAPTPQLKELTTFVGLDELRRRVERSGKALIRFVGEADEEAIRRILLLDEGTYPAPVIIVLIQAIDHAIDHRSQIATLMSQQGIELPPLDSWSYHDARQ